MWLKHGSVSALPDCQAGATTVRVVTFQVKVSVVLLKLCRGGRGRLTRVVQLAMKRRKVKVLSKYQVDLCLLQPYNTLLTFSLSLSLSLFSILSLSHADISAPCGSGRVSPSLFVSAVSLPLSFFSSASFLFFIISYSYSCHHPSL